MGSKVAAAARADGGAVSCRADAGAQAVHTETLVRGEAMAVAPEVMPGTADPEVRLEACVLR